MYLIAIGWLYVALMMAVAEASNTNGSVLGGVFTFLLYGLGPTALVMYLLGTPARKRAIKEREAVQALQEAQEAQAAASRGSDGSRDAATGSGEPDTGGQATADAVAPVRKEP